MQGTLDLLPSPGVAVARIPKVKYQNKSRLLLWDLEFMYIPNTVDQNLGNGDDDGGGGGVGDVMVVS
jgi:hypothetical protein